MQRVFSRAVAVVLTLAACGCSGSHAAVSESSGSLSATPTPAATLPAHTGLVGAIDAARREGGLTDAADQAFCAKS